MEQLLENYSLTEILTFLIILACALRGAVSFYDWAVARVRKVFNKEQSKITKEQEVNARLEKGSRIMEQLDRNQQELSLALAEITQKVDLLIESDKDDIKAFLTEKHHYFCYQRGWIDDYSLDCCEKRFAHYTTEGGNSFIEGLMNDLRHLPKEPPCEKKFDK